MTLPVSYYEPDWFECDCESHDEECESHDVECDFCNEPMPHCDCEGDD